MKLRELIKLLDGAFPFSLALSWDNSGLQVGDCEQEISSVAVALDPTFEVVSKALELGVSCLVTHHPLIFKPLRSVTSDTPVGQTVMALVEHNLSLVSLHTNLDVAPGGLADYVASLLGLEVEGPLLVDEERDLGRVGLTTNSLDFREFLTLVRTALGGGNCRIVNPPRSGEKRVWKVALCPGSGGDLVFQAVAVGAQVYITGDLKYHQAVDASSLGLTVIDAGHYGTEMPAVALLCKTLRSLVGKGITVFEIETEDPFKEDLS